MRRHRRWLWSLWRGGVESGTEKRGGFSIFRQQSQLFLGSFVFNQQRQISEKSRNYRRAIDFRRLLFRVKPAQPLHDLSLRMLRNDFIIRQGVHHMKQRNSLELRFQGGFGWCLN